MDLDDAGPESDEASGVCVSFDPDDPDSISQAEAELKRLLGGRSVPALCPPARPREGFVRRLFLFPVRLFSVR